MKQLSWQDRGRLWFRLGLRLILFLLALWIVVRWGPPLVSLFAPFLLSFLLVWALSPIVKWLHQKLGLPRKYLSLLLLVLVFWGVGGLIWLLLSVAAREILSLAGDWETLVSSLQATVDAMGVSLSRAMDLLPDSTQAAVDSLVAQFFDWLETVIPRVLTVAVDTVTNVAKGLPSFAVATIVFIMASYFLTADYPRLRAGFTDRLPEGPRLFLSMVKRAVSAGFGGYVKAELILSVGVFFILFFGFVLDGQPYALLLALALAVLDFIPILGSGTVLVPWAVIDLFTGQFRQAVSLMVVWGLVALFRQLAEPKILGNQTGLSPILSLVSVYVGMRLAGVPGMIFGPILCLVALNLLRSGVLDHTMTDIKLAATDLSAVLKDSRPLPPESESPEENV